MLRRAPTNGTSEQSLNDLIAQLGMLSGHLYTHASLMRELLDRMPRPAKVEQVVDYFRSTAGPDNPTATSTTLAFPLDWIPAPARISTLLIGVGGTAAATLQIGKRIYGINVGTNIPNPQPLPLAPEGGMVVYPQDRIVLSVPTTPVLLSLELIGVLWDHADTHQVFQ